MKTLSTLTMALIAVCLLHLNCKKLDIPRNAAATESCYCGVNRAYPDIPGEIVTFKGYDGKTVSLEKKGDKYIYMGDIELSPQQVDYLKTGHYANEDSRTAIMNIARYWPNRTVYYKINSNLPNQARVTNAIAEWQSKTNLVFVVRTNQSNYIEFMPSTGCNSALGMVGGRQVINLADGCGTGETVHEIGHAIGFLHEQSRADRDNFITINYSNIKPDKRSQFDTYIQTSTDGFELCTLDYNSIMLYDSYITDLAFVYDSSIPTLTRLNGTTWPAFKTTLSTGDVETYNYMYNPPSVFARVAWANTVDWGDMFYDYTTTDFIVELFSNAACTIPYTAPCNVKVKVALREYTNYLGGGSSYYDQVYNVTVPGGSNNSNAGNYVVSECRYGAHHDPESNCYTRYMFVMAGPGYTPR